MFATTTEGVLTALLRAHTPEQVAAVLQELGDGPSVGLMNKFGPLRLCWFPFGNRENNTSAIGLATKPGRSLTERLTNAMDAMLELAYARFMRAEPSPREAAEKWYNRPVSGPMSGLYKLDYRTSGLTSLITTVLLDSGTPTRPTIVATLNGQNQGEMPAKLLKDIGLGMVSRHIVVHIDVSKADRETRRQLFSTTRESFKDGDVLNDLTSSLKQMLEEDEKLDEIERKLTEQLTSEQTEKTSEEVKRQIIRLLTDAGLTPKQQGNTDSTGGEETDGGKSGGGGGGGGGPRQPPEPLPTLPFPDVTQLRIVHPKRLLRVHLEGRGSVAIETDAANEFDAQGLLTLVFDPPHLESAGGNPLSGGRKRWRVRPAPTAKACEKGKVKVTIEAPTGKVLTDVLEFEVLPKDDSSKTSKGNIPKFEVIGINPTDDPALWQEAWPNLAQETAEQNEVGYNIVPAGGGLFVYYSTIFAHYERMVEKLKLQDEGLLKLFQDNYKVWIGYHAILQHQAQSAGTPKLTPQEGTDPSMNTKDDASEDEMIKSLMEDERKRVAATQVKQALEFAKLQKKLLKDGVAGED